MAATAARDAQVVGREEELARLDAFLADIAAGRVPQLH
jgi:hypothetical protein